MGSVSTALTEEALSKCLKRSFYKSAPSDDTAESSNEDKDDTKCSICQVCLQLLNPFPWMITYFTLTEAFTRIHLSQIGIGI